MIETRASFDDPVVVAETRGSIYQALALGWRYPNRGAFKAYRNGRYLKELLGFAASLPHLTELVAREDETADDVCEELVETAFEAFEDRYVATFVAGVPEPSCPPYEGLYNKAMDRAAVIEELSAFYRDSGATNNQDGDGQEMPDYLGAELEFLAFLAFREARMAQDGADEFRDGYRWAQKAFLDRHIVKWLPAFAERLAEQGALPFFQHLARFTVGFTRADLGLVGSLAATGPDH
jgi:DMSO reductase family type II enzyme chaperone